MRLCLFLAAAVVYAAPAAAEVLQAPEGGKAFPVGKGRVACGPPPEGWAFEDRGRAIRPPSGEGSFNRSADVKVAAEADGCAQAKGTVGVQATGRWPELDAASVHFFPDEGRLELRGQRLAGVQVLWQAGDRAGQDSCIEPGAAGKLQHCAVPVSRGLPADAQLRWLPAGARTGADVITHDAAGQVVEPAVFALRPARIVVAQLLPPAASVDLAAGAGRIPLAHPQAVAAVDCGQARCELGEGGVVVRSVPPLATHLNIQLRLAPRHFLQRGDKLDTTASASLQILQCPLAVVSGPPLRDADDPQIIVRMDQRCARNVRLRWTIAGEPVEASAPRRIGDADYVVLHASRLASGRVTVTALRADTEGGVIGSVTTETIPAPQPRALLELPRRGRIDFIPSNRDAVLSVSGARERARLVPLPVEGVYRVHADGDRALVRGVENVGGFVALRFGYRLEGLPPELAATNLAVLSEQVQRPVREASVPAPFWIDDDRPQPLAEFLCADAKGGTRSIEPGKPARIPFEARDTCRVVIHQERLRPEDGAQEVVLEVDVTRPEGGKRADASLNHPLVLRPGGDSRTFYLKGATEQFDRVVVRLSHVVDESRYVLAPTARQAPPSVQWAATIEGGRARLYVTLAVPAGLYRMNEPTGQLTLNFGVLGRITWLDHNGKEGLLGLETGLMGMGLIPQRPQGNNEPYPRTIAAVAGLGIRVNIGPGAAVGVHLWGSYEFRDSYRYVDPKTEEERTATRFGLVFGPSISIGNVGTNL